MEVNQTARTTMGLNTMLYNAIITSSYFKYDLEHYDLNDVFEAMKGVDNVEPFIKGSDNNEASTAFCLMYKLFSLNQHLTVGQMKMMLNHKITYMRAIGLLYLRFTLPPKQLWEWLSEYLYDDTAIRLTKGDRDTTIGAVCRGLLIDKKFLNTMLPRIPVPVEKTLKANLLEAAKTQIGDATDNNKEYARSPKRDDRSRSPRRDRSRSPRRYRSRSPRRDRSRSPRRYRSRSPRRDRYNERSSRRYEDEDRYRGRDDRGSRNRYYDDRDRYHDDRGRDRRDSGRRYDRDYN